MESNETKSIVNQDEQDIGVSHEVLVTLAQIGEEVNASLDLNEVLAHSAALIKRHIDYELLGVLMVVAAFRPWLRFETMVFSTVEKGFIAYLFLSNLGQPWVMGYVGAFVVDSTIAAYGILYFLSDQGRPRRWVVKSMVDRH